jgi:soluble lytic murein transglycosylase-like protein
VLREYPALRADAARRGALAEDVVAAAAEQGVDPDLLFAVVEVESGFDPHAVSPRGARGLGQLLFATARAVAPGRIHRPADLQDPARNLHATARLLRILLEEQGGDLGPALRAYNAGPAAADQRGGGPEAYWVKVATRYATLKARRAHVRFAGRLGPAGVTETR